MKQRLNTVIFAFAAIMMICLAANKTYAQSEALLSFDDFVTWVMVPGEYDSDIQKVGDPVDVMNALKAKGFTQKGDAYRRVKNGNTIDVYIIYKNQNNQGYAIEFSNPQDVINFDKQFRNYKVTKRTASKELYKGQPIDSDARPPKTGNFARNKKGYVMVKRQKNKVRILCNAKD